ncbi:MAG: hypothetical protein HY064_15000 [Bacteroidetes bacterium]|nr:hypothetical protein [Bacteroidota bacterium]
MNKFTTIFIFAAVVFSSCRKDIPIPPAPSEFVNYIGAGNNETGRQVKQLRNGDIAVTGYDDLGIFILLTDHNGNEKWLQHYSNISGDEGWSIDERPDMGFVVAGTAKNGNGNKDFMVIKTNSDGNLTWEKYYGGAHDQTATKIKCVNDGYIICGISNSGHDNNAWILKLNNSGDSLWSYNYGGAGDDGAMDLCINSDSTYAVTGYTNTSRIGSTDGFVLVINDDGNLLYYYDFGTVNYDEPHAIDLSPDGNGWMIAGHEGSASNLATHDVFLAHIGCDGTQLWNKLYGGSDHDGGEAMVVANNTCNIIGRSSSHSGYLEDVFFLRVDVNGNLLKEGWYGTLADDAGYGIDYSNDGSFVFSGVTSGGPLGGKEIYLQRAIPR